MHPLAVEDPTKVPLRTKLERYEGTLFLVLKAARYLDESTIRSVMSTPSWGRTSW